MRGRKAVLTKPIVDALVANVEHGTIEDSARAVGYSPDTVGRWRKRGREVIDLLERGTLLVKDLSKHDVLCRDLVEGMDKSLAQVKIKYIKGVEKGGEEDWRALSWLLMVRFGMTEKRAMELSGANGGPIKVEQIAAAIAENRKHADEVADADGGGSLDGQEE